MRRLFAAIVFFCLVPLCLPAQKAVETPYAAEPYVVRSVVTRTEMHADGTGTREQTFQVQLQSDAAVHLFSVVSVNFARESQRAEFVYARVRRPDGTVVETPVDTAQVQPLPVTREAPTYSDLIASELPLRSLHVGDTLEWQYRVTEVKPDVPNQFYGQETFVKGVVVLAETHELRVPAALHVTVWTNPRAGSKPTEAVANGLRTYTWQHSENTPTVGAAAEARKLAEQKRVLTSEEELDTAHGALPSIAWTTFSDWAAVGAWYRDLVAGQANPNDAIRAKVAELTAGKATEAEKAQAVYYYVSTQLHYVAVSFGVGRLKPHTAGEVFSNQFGDCKDKHTLLAAMLNVLGVPAEPVLVGAGVRFNPEVPSPASFNHLITRATLAGKPVWLDTTNEVAPWAALLAGLRDQQALVVATAGAAVVERTPASLPYPATLTVTVQSTLNDKLASDSEMTYVFRDDTELALRLALRNMPSSGYGDAVQRLMGSFGFGGTTSNAVFKHLEDSREPLQLQFHYHRDKEESWGSNRVTLPFAPQFLPYFTADNPPTASIELGGPRTETTTITETLPAGWTANLPEAEHEDTSFAKSATSYRLDGNQLIAERRLTVAKEKLPVTEAQRYREWFDRAGASDVPYLQLQPPDKDQPLLARKPGASVPTILDNRTTGTHDVSVPELPLTVASAVGAEVHQPRSAAELVTAARPLIRDNNTVEARKLLDQAKALDPKAEGLWMGYGALDGRSGQGKAAEGDLRLELQYHPDELRAYNYLAAQQMTDGDGAGATETLRNEVRQFPLSAEAALYLVQQLERLHQYAEARDEANKALKRLANSSEDLEPLQTAADRLAKEVPASGSPPQH